MYKVVLLMLVIAMSGCAGRSPAAGSTSQPAGATRPEPDTQARMDDATLRQLNDILAQPIAGQGGGRSADLISRQFLGTPYVANRLIGSQHQPEQLVIDFRGLDCFTFIDYVEALRTAHTQSEFVRNLINIRYVNGEVSFPQRKHFFTDWAQRPRVVAKDITAQISPRAVTLEKNLNLKADGGNYLPGLKPLRRSITYIPSDNVDDKVLSQLRTGDYIGIYTNLAGLDVTHTGIFVMTDRGPMLRNASSRKENMQVVDSPFMDYVLATPGILVLRPL
ncbi:DUF1460 domain-containing protein [Serratia entomophila]|uniref:DUF1460 domain-containing protein n=1 Tax=Serratia entomophila TaxID=42906 RepID=A0ABY5CXH2_9GAMM|nr:DUF1460 domain-containing protein [Serratia entomophila]USV02213.1 DUF1460 domain-containing protein [Serratia entomophila]CAI0737909.1 Protein of uncharacterised function (DUF1460) [Serratia entomophila]CAI0764296.1 Protein of uncharacterised function (DUF1460) [Serratia entomophila]CAI0784460.1 Protein of uncharacterised function (DUF1460) [Serratia entomophila]CAI0945678.1 Protein of uncharacterised function (DUF1460) [Serratia entomophila]